MRPATTRRSTRTSTGRLSLDLWISLRVDVQLVHVGVSWSVPCAADGRVVGQGEIGDPVVGLNTLVQREVRCAAQGQCSGTVLARSRTRRTTSRAVTGCLVEANAVNSASASEVSRPVSGSTTAPRPGWRWWWPAATGPGAAPASRRSWYGRNWRPAWRAQTPGAAASRCPHAPGFRYRAAAPVPYHVDQVRPRGRRRLQAVAVGESVASATPIHVIQKALSTSPRRTPARQSTRCGSRPGPKILRSPSPPISFGGYGPANPCAGSRFTL